MKLAFPPWWKVKKTIFYYATHYTWAFAAIMAVTLASTLFSVHYLSDLETDLKTLYENDVRGGDSVQAAYTALMGLESATKDLVLFADRRAQGRARLEIKTRTAELRQAMATAAPRFTTPKAKQALAKSRVDLKAFFASLEAIVESHAAGKKIELAALSRLEDDSAVLQKDFDLLVANRIANSSIGIKEMVSQLRLSLIVTLVILVVTVGVRIVMYIAGHPRLKRRKSKGKTP